MSIASRWRDIIDTNLTAPFVIQPGSRHGACAMRQRRSLVHTASIDASGGDGPFVAYNASKAGLLGLNRTMALELASYGIRSNCVSPGFTHTVMTENSVGPKLMGYLNGSFARVPMSAWYGSTRSRRRSCSSRRTTRPLSPAPTSGSMPVDCNW